MYLQDQNFLATAPMYQRRGAITLLSRWGIEKATKEGVPICLESAANTKSLYERDEFTPAGEIVPEVGKGGENVYLRS